MNILIVDDNPFNRVLLKGILSAEGFLVEEAANGKEALNWVRRSVFHVIFMDLLMPGMDGFEVIRKIRQMGIKTPVIMVSAMSSKEDRQKCLEAGGDDFLPKPFESAQVITLLQKYKTASTESSEVSLPVVNFTEYHILLVEEDDNTAQEYRRILKRAGFTVSLASNGNQAWEAVISKPYRYHILISNMFTSGIDGLGLLARIKREFAHILVFIYANQHDPEAFQLAVQLGADGVMTEADFEISITDQIESAIFQAKQKGSRIQSASTVRQVRRAQGQLIRFGCSQPCSTIDIAWSPLGDAGGDIASCRRFNLAGRCGIVIGDVSGHNVMSSYISAFFLGLLSTLWNQNRQPLKLLKAINTEFNRASYEDYHLCAGAILWDRRRKRIHLASAGSPGALVVSVQENGKLTFYESAGGGMCLGLLPDDRLFLTDEINFESRSEHGLRYLFWFSDGMSKKQIQEILSSGAVNLNRPDIRGVSEEILDNLLQKWGQHDDMILIALKDSDPFHPKGLHYSMLSDYNEVDKACRWFMEQYTSSSHLTGKDLYLIRLAVREALINAVRHGNHFNPNAYVDMSVYADAHELRIEISDEGPGFKLPEKIQKINDVNILQSGGRGLPVMFSIADSVKVEGSTVILIFRN